MPTEIPNPPDAARLSAGLRDTGYDFLTASADIIDNSIAAGAKNVKVSINIRENGRRFVYFGDDGSGMDYNGLINALRYGSDERENPESLGKFGLGLKTASSSICRQFSVISRNTEGHDLNKVYCNLDFIKERNEWINLTETPTADDHEAFDAHCGKIGTLVVWEQCDRLLEKDYRDPGSSKEMAAVKRLRNKLKEHCALIFHKYLDPKETEFYDVSISVNEEIVEPWNPFQPDIAFQALPVESTSLQIETASGSIEPATLKAWIFPHKDELDEEGRKKAKIFVKNQGIYVYREGRLIHHGDWLGLWSPEPHSNLLRVEFNFGYKLDEVFGVGVKKDDVILDDNLLEHIHETIQPAYRSANQNYRKTQRQSVARGITHEPSNKRINETPNTASPKIKTVDSENNQATVNNNRGSSIRIKTSIGSNVDPAKLFIEPVERISQGGLWEPCLNSASSDNHSTAVRINKEHDFYTKIYSQMQSGFSVEGVDLLLWALAAAEFNSTDEELQPIWEDIREEVSSNLRKLLRNVKIPDQT